MPIAVRAVPAFADNYIWVLHDDDSNVLAVVDPGDAGAILDSDAASCPVILNTHWHPDHSGGNLAIKAATGATIYGPAAEAPRIPGLDVPLAEGDTVSVGSHVAEVWEIPGHTLGHIAYVFHDLGIAFVGDTLFAMGCGRLFEGTPAQMFRSLQRIASLPGNTRLYAAHEYTLANAVFSAAMASEDEAVAERLAEIQSLRSQGLITLPTTVEKERSTNLFLRASDVEAFATLRQAKDSFR
jgi:hydroxyacylglutathione hydrolase